MLVSVFVSRPGWYRIFGEDGERVEFEGDAADTVAYMADTLRGLRGDVGDVPAG